MCRRGREPKVPVTWRRRKIQEPEALATGGCGSRRLLPHAARENGASGAGGGTGWLADGDRAGEDGEGDNGQESGIRCQEHGGWVWESVSPGGRVCGEFGGGGGRDGSEVVMGCRWWSVGG